MEEAYARNTHNQNNNDCGRSTKTSLLPCRSRPFGKRLPRLGWRNTLLCCRRSRLLDFGVRRYLLPCYVFLDRHRRCVQALSYLGGGPSECRGPAYAMFRNVIKRLWNVLRQLGIVLVPSVPRRQMIGQRLDKGHAKRPDIGTRRDRSRCHLGRIVLVADPDKSLRLAPRANPIARKVQLIANRHNVRRFDIPMHDTLPVEV